MLEVYGKKVAKQLHSPTNHHGLDRFLDMYIDNNYDMTVQEWQELKARCEETERNLNSTEMEKDQAAFISATCVRNLMKYGIKPEVKYSDPDSNLKHS